jgi:hypothetical protein
MKHRKDNITIEEGRGHSKDYTYTTETKFEYKGT